MLKALKNKLDIKNSQGSIASLGFTMAFLMIGAFSGFLAGSLNGFFTMDRAERKAIQIAMIDPAAGALSEQAEEAAQDTTPDTIQNYAEAQIVSLFHRPDWQRRDQNKVVYQYRTDACVLDVYFSAAKNDLTIEDKTVEFVDFRKRQTIGLNNRLDVAKGALSVDEKKSCMDRLVRQASIKRRTSDVAALY
ncbi:MAG: hypothetical protein GC136_10895 [Alphaproteobacteria bacterium]|nr:hypothetical protein [Alphaproteobacteria bacterium]